MSAFWSTVPNFELRHKQSADVDVLGTIASADDMVVPFDSLLIVLIDSAIGVSATGLKLILLRELPRYMISIAISEAAKYYASAVYNEIVFCIFYLQSTIAL